MTWKITYYSDDVQEEILDFPETILARYIRLSQMMKIIRREHWNAAYQIYG